MLINFVGVFEGPAKAVIAAAATTVSSTRDMGTIFIYAGRQAAANWSTSG